MRRRAFVRNSLLSLAAARFSRGPVGASDRARSAGRQLSSVNRTDLDDAIRLACHPMSSAFNPDDNELPYFGCLMRPRAQFIALRAECFVPPVHLHALLNAENAIGAVVEPDVIERHRRGLAFSAGGKLPVPMERFSNQDMEPNSLKPGSLAFSMNGLAALVRYRNDENAHAIAERCIGQVLALWQPERGWDKEKLTEAGVTLV